MKKKKPLIVRFLDFVEIAGNKLPHPFMLFVYLALAIIGISWIISLFDISFEHPATGEVEQINNLFSSEGLDFMLSTMISNFTGFAPLGLVLVMMFGIGLAQKVGLIETFMKKTILNAPKSLVTYAILATGIIGNLASDAAFVIVPPLAAMIFYAIGRHPLAGMAAGFAGVGAGFTANVIVTGTDALLAGITTEVATTINESANVTPVDNWYFMLFSVLMLMFVGAWITEKIIEPRLGSYNPKLGEKEVVTQQLEEITPEGNRGLKNAGIASVIFAIISLVSVVPQNGVLRGDAGFVESPFLANIVPIILLYFVIVAVVYGVTVGTIKETKDVPELMAESMKDMAGYIVLIFAASQFIAYFGWSNLGAYMAVSGAETLTDLNFTGLPVIVGFILLTAVLNLFIFSGSAQWALMAPIFVPLFMLLDYNPAFIQLAYRIADSSTNIITPLNPYVPMVLAYMKRYDKNAGFGTLFSLMLPYSLIFLSIWIVLLVLWTMIGLPIGPGVAMQ